MVMQQTRNTNGSHPSAAAPIRPAEPAVHVESRAASFWSKHDKGNLNPMIPEDVRNAIVDTNCNILIHAVRQGESKFGPTWFADIEVNQGHYGGDPATVEHWTIAFSPNAVRDPMLAALREECAAGPMPASIRPFTTRDGNYGYDFSAPYPEDGVPF